MSNNQILKRKNLIKFNSEIIYRQKESFRVLTENSPDLIMRFDRDYRHLYVNSRVIECLGIPQKEFINKTHQELGFPKHQYEYFDAAIEVVFQTGKDHHVELDLDNGIWLDWILFPEFDEFGNVATVITSARDISELKHTQIKLKRAKEELKYKNEKLEEKIVTRNRELEEIQDTTLVALGALAESRDLETGNHIKRTQRYVKLLAEYLQNNPRFEKFLTPRMINILFKTASLHDIGKVGVSDHILLKPGKLTKEEFEQMKLHTTYGRDALIAAEGLSSAPQAFLLVAEEIIYSHHEKWDGSGYPVGLKGEEIPISARLMALADVYDALISERIYKPAFSHSKAVEIISEGKGTHFDSDVADAFIALSKEFFEISKEYVDEKKFR